MFETTCYRFYTEDTRNTLEGATALDKWVSTVFPMGATVYAAEGIWHGGQEMTLVIEVITSEQTLDDMKQIAEDLKVFNKQEAVLLTMQPVTIAFV